MTTGAIAKSPQEAARHEWRHVPVGACIRLKSGIWHVVERNGDEITMRNPRNNHVATGTPPPGNLVVILQPGDPLYVPPPDELAAARRIEHLSEPAREMLTGALVQTMLGGHVVAVRDLDRPDAPQQCPSAEGMAARHLAAHLYLLHRLEPDDVLDLAAPPEITVLHALHDSRRAFTAHCHTL